MTIKEPSFQSAVVNSLIGMACLSFAKAQYSDFQIIVNGRVRSIVPPATLAKVGGVLFGSLIVMVAVSDKIFKSMNWKSEWAVVPQMAIAMASSVVISAAVATAAGWTASMRAGLKVSGIALLALFGSALLLSSAIEIICLIRQKV